MILCFFGETMPNDNNLPIETVGVNAEIGTDIFVTDGVTAHAQVVKIAWGNDENVIRVTAGTPLPVQVYGVVGNTPTLTVTGSVYGLGNFTIANTETTPIHVTGGIISRVQGITGATPVSVTGGVRILSDVGVTGVVNVTGGRRLDLSTDSVLIGGTAARNWNLTAVDVVRVLDASGGSTFATKILGASGSDFVPIGASGDALKVVIVNTGFSASITFDSVVSVQNSGSSALRVQGTANGTPITVQFQGAPDVVIANNDDIFTVDSFEPGDYTSGNSLQRFYYGFDRNSEAWRRANNLEKLLLGAKPNTDVYHTIGQWLGFIWNDLAGSATTGDLDLKTVLNMIKNNFNSATNSDGSFRTSSTVNYTAGDSFHFVLNSSFATLIDYTLPSTSSTRNGIMYVNSDSSEILLLSNNSLNQLLTDPSTAIGFNVPQSGNQTTVWRGSPINPTTIVNNKSPYYMGYRLPSNQSIILPYQFDWAIPVTSASSATNIENINLTLLY